MKWIILLFFSSSLFGRDVDPWFSKSFEFEPKLSYTYAHFDDVDTEFGPVSYVNNCQFLNLNIGFTYFDKNVQLEFQTADTKSRSFGPEYFGITGRKLLLNDVNGQDPISAAMGLTLLFPWEQSLHDVAVFHHSRADAELFLSLGKEFSCTSFWDFRAFVLGGFGCGVQGSPWFHGLFGLKKNLCDIHELHLNLDYLKGFGDENIFTPDPFVGYANIDHQSLDLQIGYAYTWFPWGSVGVDYLERLYSRNCPLHYRAITLSLLIPFSL